MIRNKSNTYKPRVVDLDGPEGNAFVLLGIAQETMRQLRWSKEKQNEVICEMKSSNYTNLLITFDSLFGDHFILESKNINSLLGKEYA